ncbi:MAG: hypothetical protein M1819_006540 [Sarea resinae]|nr:MAG: hypothetical protein M1819_006540 [Sarea resinae]
MATFQNPDGTVVPTVVPPAVEFPFPRSSSVSAASVTDAQLQEKRPAADYETPGAVAPTRVASSSTLDAPKVPMRAVSTSSLEAPDAPARTLSANTVGSMKASSPWKAPRTRPAARKSITERPMVAPRGSLFAIKRRATGGGPTELNKAAWRSSTSSDSDDLSSSSDEEGDQKSEQAKSKSSSGTAAAAHLKERAKHLGGRKGSKDDPYSRFSVGNDLYKTRGRVSQRDGRLNISLSETANSGYLAKALGATLKHHFAKRDWDDDRTVSPVREEEERPGLSREPTASAAPSAYETAPRPILNIVIMVIGSRGDIQPFLKIGKILKEDYGHRVRIATHPAFKKFVEQDSGLEFFSVGGDPAELMAFMVKNPGLIPSVETVKAGEIGRRREAMFEMFQGFWRACINATDDEKDIANLKMMGNKHPFVADAIIANPPSFAHVHCAERLGIPLHLMFTFPYTPTQQFPHPLANIKRTNVDTNYSNFISYPLVEMMTWQGLGDLVNIFRVKTLGLEPVSTLWAPGQLYRLKVPYTYMWSPGLVPKPADWGPEITIAGFVFLDLASSFEPPESLTKFLEAGPPPVYIGFGSIVVSDPEKFTAMIFEAVEKAGVRALVSKGWGGLGDEGNTPDNIYMLDNIPHDWLFPRVSAVIHHGGAGTTAIGLKCGKPTMIVPFFGDQPFWGAMVAKAGAGASESIPYKYLTADRLAEGIRECLTPEAQENAQKLADGIAAEGDGARNAVRAFHQALPLRGEHSMRCSIFHDRVAVWALENTHIRLSALAAEILVEMKKVQWRDLHLLRHREWNDFDGPGEPLTGGGAALWNAASGVARGIGGVPVRWAKMIKKRKRLVGKEAQEDGKASEHDKREKKSAANDNPQHGGHRIPHDTQPSGGLMKEMGNDEDAQESGTAVDGPEEAAEIARDMAEEAGRGLTVSGEALAKAPMNLSLAIAQGFHNAPRLYGDKTVRRPIRITGMKSGLRAAGDEFIYGIWDGWTGVVMQPYTGARDEGSVGFIKGVARGFGGFILKDIAAIIGPFGYTLKGIHKEIQKGHQPTAFIRRARIIQGQKDLRELSLPERKEAFDIVGRSWKIIKEIKTTMEETKQHSRGGGIRGRKDASREKRTWEASGVFENVQQAHEALRAKRQGKNIPKYFRRHRESVAQNGGPVSPLPMGGDEAKKTKTPTVKRATKEGGVGRKAAKAPMMDGVVEEPEVTPEGLRSKSEPEPHTAGVEGVDHGHGDADVNANGDAKMNGNGSGMANGLLSPAPESQPQQQKLGHSLSLPDQSTGGRLHLDGALAMDKLPMANGAVVA